MTTNSAFHVLCQVSGGVTGTRRGLMKDAEGHVKEFATRQEAEQEVAHLYQVVSTVYTGARFTYSVVEARGGRTNMLWAIALGTLVGLFAGFAVLAAMRRVAGGMR